MDVKFTLRGVELNQSEMEALRRKADFAFNRFDDKIESVHVVLEDINGPRGGEDKVCRVVLHLVREPAAILQERGDAAVATGIAALERAAQAVQRRYEKNRSRRTNGSGFWLAGQAASG